jgi:hypothetical protein
MKGTAMKQLRPYPTPEEIIAFKRAARRAQAEEMIRLATLAASKLKTRTRQFAAALTRAIDQPRAPASGSSSRNPGARATLASIMEELAATLPAELKAHYTEELAAAARFAPMIDFGLAAWDFAVRALAQVFRGAALGLRVGAWSLDMAAQRFRRMLILGR